MPEATDRHRSSTALPAEWAERLDRAGLRQTSATLGVLRWFVQHAEATVTHAELAQAMQEEGVGLHRVSLYRLLDRLAQHGLLLRQADPNDRSWRFQLPLTANHHGAARFECDACHRQYPLADTDPSARAATEQLLHALAAQGHHAQWVDWSIHGTCAGCASGHHPP